MLIKVAGVNADFKHLIDYIGLDNLLSIASFSVSAVCETIN
jgi:hypothetical protein